VEAGVPRNDDFNGAVQEGVGYYQTTSRRGLRSSAAAAYLRPVRGRRNLQIETGGLALRVRLRGRSARGIVYRKAGREVEVDARGEVILCGGAINSPQLLQLSGIGPGTLLREHGIEVVRDLPGVGANLQDHYQARNVYECRRPLTVNDEVRNPLAKVLAGLKWLFWRSGPLTVSAAHVGVFAPTRPELASPDVQFHFIRFSAEGPGQGLHPFSGFTVSVCQLRPESRGRIHIRSRDPAEAPVIEPNYLATEGDRRTMRDGMKLARRIISMPAIAGYVRREVLPGPAVATDDELDAYIRETGSTIFHPAGTCRMGREAGAVVDERLRVHGVGNLRVADASVMPTVVSGNTNAPCIMIGEKCADLVREDAG
jgi:choline dehydrogenase